MTIGRPPRRRATALRGTLILAASLASACGDGTPSQPEAITDPCDAQPFISVGQSVSGELRSGDCLRALSFEDRFTLSLQATAEVRIDLRSSAFDALLELWTASGLLLHRGDDTGTTDARIITTLQPGSYRVHATSFSPGETGRYTLSVAEAPSCSPVGALVPGDTVSGVIDAADCLLPDQPGHWENWLLSLTESVRLRLWMSSADFEESLMITAPGESEPYWVAYGSYSPTGSAMTELDLHPGVWRIAAGTPDETESGAYRLAAWPAPPCGPGTPLLTGTPVFGELTEADCLFEGAFPADSFSLSLASESALSIALISSGLSPLLGVIEDGYWSAWADASADGVTFPDTARLRIVLPAGDWPVIAGTFAEPWTGSYALDVRDAVCTMPDTIATGQSRAGGLALDDCLGPRGTLQDRWSITLPVDTTLRVDLASASFDAFLVLRTSDGAVVAVDDDGAGGLNSRIQGRFPAGTYQIAVQSFGPGEGGAYTLTVSTAASAARSPSTAAPTGKMAPGPWLPRGVSLLPSPPGDAR